MTSHPCNDDSLPILGNSPAQEIGYRCKRSSLLASAGPSACGALSWDAEHLCFPMQSSIAGCQGAPPSRAFLSNSVRTFSNTKTSLREARYRKFVAETGVKVHEPTWPAATMQATLRALTVAPVDNTYKEPFWRCFFNGLPTAARLHIRQRCGCGASESSPDRSHHFHRCRVARAVLAQIDDSASDVAHLVASLRAIVPPAGVHKGTWAIVCLTAHYAMETGRRSLIHSRLAIESS
jgi:hypothetical protein